MAGSCSVYSFFLDRMDDYIFTVTPAADFPGIGRTACWDFISLFPAVFFHRHDKAFGAASHVHAPFHS